jgi:hypothetical protein
MSMMRVVYLYETTVSKLDGVAGKRKAGRGLRLTVLSPGGTINEAKGSVIDGEWGRGLIGIVDVLSKQSSRISAVSALRRSRFGR